MFKLPIQPDQLQRPSNEPRSSTVAEEAVNGQSPNAVGGIGCVQGHCCVPSQVLWWPGPGLGQSTEAHRKSSSHRSGNTKKIKGDDLVEDAIRFNETGWPDSCKAIAAHKHSLSVEFTSRLGYLIWGGLLAKDKEFKTGEPHTGFLDAWSSSIARTFANWSQK